MSFREIPLSEVKVLRDKRQRRDISTSNLLESIRQNGVLNPIILTAEGVLVAGERRLECAKALGLKTIPARLMADLSEVEAQTIELEENLRRQDIPWRDQVAAVARIHELNSKADPKWTQAKTAELIGASPASVSQHLRIAADIDNPKIAGATGLMAAFNILDRMDERKAAEASAFIADTARSVATGHAPKPQAPEPPDSILNVDFKDWVKSYSGPAFNLIHCDFPYGIGVFDGVFGSRSRGPALYDDGEPVYWELVETLCANLDRLMTPSAHLVFWLSMNHYSKTLEAFQRLAPSLTFCPFPWVWLKSDNVGIAPDPRREGRRVYETALVASRDDRPIVKVVANAYSAPTDKSHHPSTKPEPVLRHFLSQLVDDSTRLLDPTCGSGSALRAAESLGAKSVLGLERDPEHFRAASSALRTFRTLRRASGGRP